MTGIAQFRFENNFGRRRDAVDCGVRTPTDGGCPPMSWISDKFLKLKALWQRFERWERQHIGYEEEWCFPVYGSAAEFEQRYRFLIPTISKSEFYRELNRWFSYRRVSYFDDGEIGLKTPNPFPYITIAAYFSLFSASSLYYYQGKLELQSDGLKLRGNFRPQLAVLNGPINFFTFGLTVGAILTLSGVAISLWLVFKGAPFIDFASALALMVFGSLIAAFGLVVRYFTGSFFWAQDRGASLEIQRMLKAVCGNPIEF